MQSQIKNQTLYLSFDIESDGPVPGLNSMMSFGIVFMDITKKHYKTIEAVLKPLDGADQDPDTMKWWSTQPDAYKYSTTNQQNPEEVFVNLTREINELKKKYTIVPVAWPASYDWQFLNYYFWKFTNSNPLGFSCKCIGSYLWGMSKKVFHHIDDELSKKYSDPTLPHTHKPLDDAIEQGTLFINALNDNKLINYER